MSKFTRVASLIVAAGTIVLSLTACGFLGGAAKTTPADKSTAAESKKGLVSKDADEKIQKVINKYFTQLYSISVDKYAPNIASGAVPDSIKDLVAKQTIDEGNSNPEISIHLPRYVDINGLVAINYELLKYEKDKPQIDSNFVGMKGDSYLYYSKVNLKVKCLNEAAFTAYKEDAATHTYTVPATVDQNAVEYTKEQAKYDIRIVKQGNDYKVLSATEANVKYKYSNRLYKLNNEFMERLPYLFIKETLDSVKCIDKDDINKYVDSNDKKTYDTEKKVIDSFFKKLSYIDSSRNDLMRNEWAKGPTQFSDQIAKINIPKDDKSDKKNLVDLMNIDINYKTNFDIASFPIQVNMDRIVKIDSINIVPHPAYSDKRKKYIVKIDATVAPKSVILDDQEKYRYDYYIELTDSAITKVNKLKLNECVKLQK